MAAAACTAPGVARGQALLRITVGTAAIDGGIVPLVGHSHGDLPAQKIARVDGATSSDRSLIQAVIDAAGKYKNIPRAFPAKEIYFAG